MAAPAAVETPVAIGAPRGWACDCASCPFLNAGCSGCNASCASCLCRMDSCDNCVIRCADRRGLNQWLDTVAGTIDFDVPAGTGPVWATLPRLIWESAGSHSLFPPQEWWAVPAKRSVTVMGHPSVTSPEDPTRRLWFGWGGDEVLERWWTNRDGWISEAADKALFDAALAPNFSIFGNHPRMEHLFNMRRSLLSAWLIEQAGIPCAAHLYWYRREDLTRWIEWLWKHRPAAVAHNLSTLRHTNVWQRHLPGLKLLAREAPPDVRWVFGGTRSRDKIRALGELFPNFVLITTAPAMMAWQGRVLTPDAKEKSSGGLLPYEASQITAAVLNGWLADS